MNEEITLGSQWEHRYLFEHGRPLEGVQRPNLFTVTDLKPAHVSVVQATLEQTLPPEQATTWEEASFRSTFRPHGTA